MAQTLTVTTNQNITRIVGQTTLAGTLAVVVAVPDSNTSPPAQMRWRLKVIRLVNAGGALHDFIAIQQVVKPVVSGGIAPGNTITSSTSTFNLWESSEPAGPIVDQTNLDNEFRINPGEVLGITWTTTVAANDTTTGYVFALSMYHALKG